MYNSKRTHEKLTWSVRVIQQDNYWKYTMWEIKVVLKKHTSCTSDHEIRTRKKIYGKIGTIKSRQQLTAELKETCHAGW